MNSSERCIYLIFIIEDIPEPGREPVGTTYW